MTRFLATIFASASLCATGGKAEVIFGVTADQTLVSFGSRDPQVVRSEVAITGLQSNEQIRGIDFLPGTGEMYALGSFSNLYTVDTITGAASLVVAFGTSLHGSSFGFDFLPDNRIRIVSNVGQNLVVNPMNGAVSVGVQLFYAADDPNEGETPRVVGSASRLSLGTPLSFAIDSALNILVTQATRGGTLRTVGALGVNITDVAGFDSSRYSGFLYLAGVRTGDSFSTLWIVNRETGRAMEVGAIGNGLTLTGVSVIPSPASAALLALGGILSGCRRR